MSSSPERHHPQGPSQLAHLDPRSGGCLLFQASEANHVKAELGTRQHLAWATGDLTVLGGDTEAESQVVDTAHWFSQFDKRFPIQEREVLLELPHVNFGTADLIGFNEAGNFALVGDGKFGRWQVQPAHRNLQVINYAAAIFLAHPKVHRVLTALYMARHAMGTTHIFLRHSLPKMVTRIRSIVENVQRALADPKRSDYTPHPVNCGFCSRVNCPARLDLASKVVTAWTGVPWNFKPGSLINLSLPELGVLKALNLALRKFSESIDNEARRRAFDEGQIIPGYEIREDPSPRRVIGVDNLNRTQIVLDEVLEKAYPEIDFKIGDCLMQHTEISLADLQRAASRAAPRGEVMRAQQLILHALEQQKLVDSHPIFKLVVSAK